MGKLIDHNLFNADVMLSEMTLVYEAILQIFAQFEFDNKFVSTNAYDHKPYSLDQIPLRFYDGKPVDLKSFGEVYA